MVGLIVRRVIAALLGAGMVTLLAVVTPKPDATPRPAPAETDQGHRYARNGTPTHSSGRSATPAPSHSR
jgi:hypothetical protein